MKKTILTLALVGLSTAAIHAQGTIQFLNTFLNKVKYVAVPGGAAVDAPVGTVIGVYYGSDMRLAPNTAVMTAPGIWNGGATYALPGTQPGQEVSIKIAGWLNSADIAATPRVLSASKAGATHYGETAVVTTTALGPDTGPGTVIWQSATQTSPNKLKPFEIVQIVPEPSVVALGALGLGALLLRRRKA